MYHHPTRKQPKRVALVGLGPSRAAWCEAMTAHEPDRFDEVWTFNTGIRWLAHDVAFVMDDLRYYAAQFPDYGALLQKARRPIVTSRAYPEFTRSHAYPLAQVLNAFGHVNAQFSHNSTPYVIAYALLIGVRELVLFGVDYTHAGISTSEAGRGACEYWIGFARAKGMEVTVSAASSLTDANQRSNVNYRPFYGYQHQPVLTRRNGFITVNYGDKPFVPGIHDQQSNTQVECGPGKWINSDKEYQADRIAMMNGFKPEADKQSDK